MHKKRRNFEYEDWIVNVFTNPDGSGSQIGEFTEVDLLQTLSRLDKTKREAEKIMKKRRAKRMEKIEEINRRMGHMNLEEAEPFNPYEKELNSGSRRRSRGLTYMENIELQKYQKRIGIKLKPKPQAKPKMRPKPSDYPSANLGKPIGKPTNKPVIPLPGQKGPLHSTVSPQVPQGMHNTNPPAAASGHLGYSHQPKPPHTYPHYTTPSYPHPRGPPPTIAQPKVTPTDPPTKKKKGLARWFGL